MKTAAKTERWRAGALRAGALSTGAAILVAALAGSPAGSQDSAGVTAGASAGGPQATFLEQLDVRVVNLEVFVTDKRGRPVAGLTARDFEVYEDGAPVTLEYFTPPQDGGDLDAGDPATEIDAVADAGDEAVPDAAVDVAAPTPSPHVVLFVDNLNLQPHNRRRVLDEVRKFIRAGGDADTRFMVASYDGHVEVRQGFTAEAARVEAALDGMGRLSGPAAARQSERFALMREGQQVLRTIGEANAAAQSGRDADNLRRLAESRFTTLMRQVEVYAQQLHAETHRAVRAMSSFVDSLAALPGRKALIYVSDGVPVRPGEEMFYAMEETFSGGRELRFADGGGGAAGGGGGTGGGQGAGGTGGGGSAGAQFQSSEKLNVISYLTRSQRFDLTRPFAELAALANTHRVTFYSIDARAGAGTSAAVEGRLGPLMSGGFKAIDDANRWATLDLLSEDTGGATLTGADVDGFLARASADFSRYYSLGYTPPHDADGAQHQVEVKLKKRGLKLRYRRSYVDQPRQDKLAARTTATLLLGLDDNPHGLYLETLPPLAAEAPHQRTVPVLVKVPLASVALLPRGEVHACDARLFFAAASPEGYVGEVREIPFTIEIPNADLGRVADHYYTARLDVVVGEEPQQVAVGFWDETGGEGSFVRHEIAAGEEPAAETAPVEGQREQ